MEQALSIIDEAIKELDDTGSENANMVREQRRDARERLAGRDFEHRIVVQTRGIGKTFPDFELKDVDLELHLGRITGVVGENANGKTTLFRILVGELKQSSGQICYPELGSPDSSNVNWAVVRRQIAYVPQTLSPWPGSLEDNLRFAASSHGILGRENDEEFLFITERLGLREFLNKKWRELSGGYRLRFELARALIWRPKLLALDEPLANLDFKGQLTLLRDIRALARSYSSPIAVIISSQHLHEVEAVADNILFLRRGEVLFNGPTSDVGDNRRSNTFEINCSGSLADVKAALDGQPIQRIYFNGLSIVIDADTGLGGPAVLQLLTDAGLELTYFRDLSRSVKQLFEQTVIRQ